MSRTRTLYKAAGKNVVASALPLVAGSLTVVLFRYLYGADAVVAMGYTTNAFGLVSVLSVGLGIAAMRGTIMARKKHGLDPERWNAFLANQYPLLWPASIISGVAAAGIAIAFAALTRADVGLVTIFVAAAFAQWVLGPFVSVTASILQGLGEDSLLARIALIVFGGQLLTLGVVGWWQPGVMWAVALICSTNALLTLWGCVVRARTVARITGQTNLGFMGPRGRVPAAREVATRMLAGADAVVYMSTFMVALTVASAHSPATGATIAVAISAFRTVIIPTKQLGLIGGRMIAQGTAGMTYGALSLAALWPCLVLAVGVVLWSLGSPDVVPLTLALLMAAQLLLEPIAGVKFSAVRIVRGVTLGNGFLLALYLAGVIPALVLLGFAGWASATAIWLVFIVARVGLAIRTQVSARA